MIKSFPLWYSRDGELSIRKGNANPKSNINENQINKNNPNDWHPAWLSTPVMAEVQEKLPAQIKPRESIS